MTDTRTTNLRDRSLGIADRATDALEHVCPICRRTGLDPDDARCPDRVACRRVAEAVAPAEATARPDYDYGPIMSASRGKEGLRHDGS